ncbi:MAG: sigma-70 family RNA polymerase sigma factor [Pyrinomonas methylaliphatogenes]|nr:sigma-70 family RNA polymerase sigma factor [Pyrinomonas methylaliphatogenes]
MRVVKPRSQDQSDAELVRAIAQGDERALAAFYDRYASILFGLLLRILNDRSEAEDVLQEVFLQVWQEAERFDGARGRPFTWLVTIARSRAIDRVRARNSRDRKEMQASRSSWSETDEITQQLSRTEEREIVRRALAEIPEEQRDVLLLAYFEGLSQSEIATRTGAPLGTIKTRMRAGLRRLREILREKITEGRR